MAVRGIRGATSVEDDTEDEIIEATTELIGALIERNPGLLEPDVASLILTVTTDLRSTFPAAAVRRYGWKDVPMICATEIPVTGSLPRCIRVLIHWNTDRKQNEIGHVYLRRAKALRPDRAID